MKIDSKLIEYFSENLKRMFISHSNLIFLVLLKCQLFIKMSALLIWAKRVQQALLSHFEL